jgi:porphobilinogen synthase
MGFPEQRLRRSRISPPIRQMLSETDLNIKDLIYPVFVHDGNTVDIQSMPGQKRYNPKDLLKELSSLVERGLSKYIVFGIPSKKDEIASEAYNDEGVVQRTVKLLKKELSDIVLITDVCLCGYTSHGHCGVVRNGKIVNDETLELLAKTALSHARAGADIVAPSDMMDGRVKAIRSTLDREGFTDTLIMSYAAKYASALYGPFREAAESAPSFGDRASYQMNPPNIREAMREIELDIEEGADIIMVKPATFYLDVIKTASEKFPLPLAAYSVSGEYSMIKAASKSGFMDEVKAVREMLICIKRAGADLIITYFAKDFAEGKV